MLSRAPFASRVDRPGARVTEAVEQVVVGWVSKVEMDALSCFVHGRQSLNRNSSQGLSLAVKGLKMRTTLYDSIIACGLCPIDELNRLVRVKSIDLAVKG